MTSPFPGMDPYLESSWGNVHNRLVTYITDEIQDRLPEGLRARMEERVYLELPGDDPKVFIPDARVVERPGRGPRRAAPPGVEMLAIAEPLLLVADDPVDEAYIEIVDARSGGRLVTSIEVLSPTNKWAGKGRKLYVRKRRRLRAGRVNTVEIDLLRDGPRLIPGPPWHLSPARRTAYGVGVWRTTRSDEYAFFRAPLRERLPVIPIPLRRTDPDLPLDLQPLLDRCYRNGGYEDTDYRRPPEPPLDAEDEAWADALLRERGLR